MRIPFRQTIGSPVATTTSAGLMSAADKAKLDKITSGTYAPTGTAVANVDSVSGTSAIYDRIGDVVFVDGVATVDPTASGQVTFGISLPIPSNLAAATDLYGVAGQGNPFPGVVYADTTNDRATCYINNNSTSASTFYFQFAYRVL